MRYHEIIREDAYSQLKDYVRNNTYISPSVISLIPEHPSKAGKVFRGLCFNTKETYDAFMDKVGSGSIQLDGASSWTKSKTIAQDFATLEKSYDPSAEIITGMKMMNATGDFTYAYGGVVIETTITDGQGLDVSSAFGNSSAEGEIILPRGKYEVSVAQVIVPYRRQYDSPEKVQALYDRIMAGEDQDKIHFFTQSILPHLPPEKIKAYSDKTLSSIMSEELFSHIVRHDGRTSDFQFTANFSDEDFNNASPSIREEIGRRGAEAAKRFFSEIDALPDEAFVARSGVYLGGKKYVPQWSTLSRALVMRLARVYQDINERTGDRPKNMAEISAFGSSIERLLTLMSALK